jgi:protein-L-isoaspartate(D-aspartate) O-methyltransferase
VILGPEPVEDLAELPPSDWSFLDRYKKVARRTASQAQIYLSRGCPFDCAFCMERAKREVSWRPLPVERAVEEMKLLHEWLDLRSWTLYVADALFGMKKSWRRSFLEELARLALPIDKIWLLIRVDLVEDEDLALFFDANCGLGFGLESGDPAQLATIRKAGRLDEYLDRMRHVAAWARERNVPWGANVICGHPGETRASMERSAAYLSELFLDERGTTGFLSVDPFRLYPGSPIDAERGAWEQRFGTRFYRPEWWEDGDPEFLSEWVDPSAELGWLERESLQAELLGPVLAQIEEHFVYDGPAREYFLRAVREQVAFGAPRHRLHYIDRYYAWMRYLGFGTRADAERRKHEDVATLARAERRRALPVVAKRARVREEHPVLGAIDRAPRERFVPLDAVMESTRDVPIALDADGRATVSAMHAYARAFDLLAVSAGDHVLDLGAGTGYGAALLRDLVGDGGRVHAVEIDPKLAAAAAKNLDGTGVTIVEGDAIDPAEWGVSGAWKVYAGFALEALPPAWAEALGEGARIVAPLVENGAQHLVRATVTRDRAFDVERFEEVRYVPTRTRETTARPVAEQRGKRARRLYVVSSD